VEKTARSAGLATAVTLAVITLAGLGLRVGYAVEQPYEQPPDARAYERIAESLYRDGSFDARPPGVEREIQPSSSYAPGLPLLLAGVYVISGGVHLTLALVLLAVISAAAVPLTFLLGRRFAGPVAGLIGAGLLAVYPALIEYQALVLTEPLAAFLLVASLLSFISARDQSRSRTWPAWAGAGALFGLLALVRPEYLALGVLLPLTGLLWEAAAGGMPFRRASLPAGVSLLGTLLVLAPWTVRNAIVLDQATPVSSGGGKALYIGTYLDADGDGPKLRELLLDERPRLRARLEREGRVDDPDRLVLERVLARVAAESHPGLETDSALAMLGRENLIDDVTEEPLRFAGMLSAKAYEAWTDSAREVMEKEPWRALQLAIVILALAGLVTLTIRLPFEGLACSLVLAYMTVVSALLIASPRRELVVLPLLAALAGACAVEAGRAARARRPARG
jgi:4-amino-4-deoxy-L-arabinose transferase-like glycosyltransferase